jgi:GNAT superfamily N-acetyltransferase/uncharacterized protein YndB with AHSA1/START domain
VVSTVEIGATPEAVWQALVETGARRPWYFDLQPMGEFHAGAAVRWLQADGKEAEVSTVREAAAPRRLVLETRYLFAPVFAEQPPHRVTYQIEPAGGGSRVTMTVDAPPGPVTQLFEGEGGAILQGLRLALDPQARAELARLDEIGTLEIHDVTPDRVGDYQAFFDHDAFRDYPAWQFCYCMETHFAGSADEQAARTAADNRRDMSRMIADGQVTGLLAYADGKAVAWCNYGPTTRLAGLMHKLHLDPAEQEHVGSIACFVVAAPYRGHGLARQLLDAACDRLAARGLEWVEAYPGKAGDSPQSQYRGPLAMYIAAGFEPFRETDRQAVVRKRLG